MIQGLPMVEKFKKIFFARSFFHYTWTGVIASVLQVFFLWLLIDMMDISTILASVLVIGVTFILRYLVLYMFDVFGYSG